MLLSLIAERKALTIATGPVVFRVAPGRSLRLLSGAERGAATLAQVRREKRHIPRPPATSKALRPGRRFMVSDADCLDEWPDREGLKGNVEEKTGGEVG